MPKSNASNTPTDGNASQWEKVKEMRDRQAAVVAGEPAGTPIQVIGVEAQAEESPAPPAVEQPRNPDGTFAAKEPEAKLLIENPDEWAKQNRAFEDYRLEKVRREAKEEALREVRARDATAAKDAEAHARAVVREQFYGNYPVLKDSADIVDIVLTKAMDDLVATGKLSRPLQPAEQEAMKKALFADVATKATRRLVQLMSGGKKVAPPAEPPPAVVSSAPKKAAKPPAEEPAEVKPKYPKGSISAALAERRSKQAGASA